jgi:hypothetical protein
MGIGSGGSFYLKIGIDSVAKTIQMAENYSVSISNFYEGNLIFDLSGGFFIQVGKGGKVGIFGYSGVSGISVIQEYVNASLGDLFGVTRIIQNEFYISNNMAKVWKLVVDSSTK